MTALNAGSAPTVDAVRALAAWFDTLAEKVGWTAENAASAFAARDAALAAAPAPAGSAEPDSYPECSGDPADCPENEGFGCCGGRTLAAAPAPAVGREAVAAAWDEERRYPGLADLLPPAEAREPVGVTDAMVREARVLIDRMDDSTYIADKTLRAVMALAQPRDTPRDSGDAIYTAEEVDEAMEVLRGRHGSTALHADVLDAMERQLRAAMQPPTGEPSNADPA